MGEKKITLGSMIMFGVSSLVVLYTFAKSAGFGVSGLGVWAIMIVLFLIPSTLAVGELASTYTEAGGIAQWVGRAFGDLAGSLVGWWYWVNYVFGLPSVYVTVVGILSGFFWPDMPNMVQMGIVIALIVMTCFLGIFSTTLTAKVTAYGGTVVVALVILAVVLAGAYCGTTGTVASDFSLANMIPGGSKFISMAPVVVFNLLGMELLSSVASSCEDPARDIPKFTIVTGIIVALAYVAATVSILVVIPEGTVDTVNGFSDAIRIASVGLFGESAGNAITTVAIIGMVYALCASGIGWAMGSSNIIAAAGLGEKSKIFGHTHPKFGTPDYAFYIVGGVGCLFTVGMFMGGDSINAVFDIMFSFSSIIYLSSYAFMYPALIKLRSVDPDRPRPFKVPGKFGLIYAGLFPCACIILAMVSFSLPANGGDLMSSLAINWGGFGLITLIGFLLYLNGKRNEKAQAAVAQKSEA